MARRDQQDNDEQPELPVQHKPMILRQLPEATSSTSSATTRRHIDWLLVVSIVGVIAVIVFGVLPYLV